MGVFDENDVFRRGVEACVGDDGIDVVATGRTLPVGSGVPTLDVAVVSSGLAVDWLRCPLVVCATEPVTAAVDARNVGAVLPRHTLDAPQLLGAVRAVAAGLCIAGDAAVAMRPALDPRSVAVLELLAEGASTADISAALGYSVRTIKAVIGRAVDLLGCRTRAQAVATAVRMQLI